MELSDGRRSFRIGLAVLIQYRSVTASHPASQPRCRSYTLNAKASSLKRRREKLWQSHFSIQYIISTSVTQVKNDFLAEHPYATQYLQSKQGCLLYIHCYCVQTTKLIWKLFWSPPNPIIVFGTKLLQNTNTKPQPVCRIWIAPIWVTSDPHFKVTTLFDIKYLKDNTRQNHNHYRTSTESQMRSITWWHPVWFRISVL